MDLVDLFLCKHDAQCLGHSLDVFNCVDANDGEDISRLVEQVCKGLQMLGLSIWGSDMTYHSLECGSFTGSNFLQCFARFQGSLRRLNVRRIWVIFPCLSLFSCK